MSRLSNPEWKAEVMRACLAAQEETNGEFRISDVFKRLDEDDILRVRRTMGILEGEGRLTMLVRDAKLYWRVPSYDTDSPVVLTPSELEDSQ